MLNCSNAERLLEDRWASNERPILAALSNELFSNRSDRPRSQVVGSVGPHRRTTHAPLYFFDLRGFL